MKETVLLSSKGQVVIPKRIRESLGLKKGSLIEIEAKKGIIYLKPLKGEEKISHWQDLRGLIKGRFSTEKFLKERTKERDKENRTRS